MEADGPALVKRVFEAGYDIWKPAGCFGYARALFLAVETKSSILFVCFDHKFDPRRRLAWGMGNSFEVLDTFAFPGCRDAWDDYLLIQAMKADS
eukprot:UN0200